MKWLKIILLGLTILLSTSFTNPSIMEDKATVVYSDWQCANCGQWGSFYWKIERSKAYDADFKYWYYVYFYSNSYFSTDNNGDGKSDPATAYVAPVNMYMYYNYNGSKTFVNTLPYVLVDWKTTMVMSFWAIDPNAKFYLEYGAISPYNYSMIKK